MQWHPYKPVGRSSLPRRLKVIIKTFFFYWQTLNVFIVYPGMIIGESSKSNDLYLNPCIKKQLTNIRAAAADEKIVLASPRTLTLEEALSYMADDELVE